MLRVLVLVMEIFGLRFDIPCFEIFVLWPNLALHAVSDQLLARLSSCVTVTVHMYVLR